MSLILTMKIFWRLLALLSYSQFCHALNETTDPLLESTETILETSCLNDGTCQLPGMASANSSQCGVYLAMSTLPGTGIGMFAGKSFKEGDEMLPAGDHILPFVDVALSHGHDIFFLWDEYTWNAVAFKCANLGVQEVNIASPGFGAAANSFMDFINVDEGYGTHSVAQDLHRSKDPGAGAFSYWHSRMATASAEIEAGQELFVSYGSHWFQEREHLGAIPIKGDHTKAENFYKHYEMLKDKLENSAVLPHLWDTFIANNSWGSRVFAALPPKEDLDEMKKVGLRNLKRSRMVRSEDWLHEHGVCADNVRIRVSTLDQAGHGAFATRFLAMGSAVMPMPLIHIPNRKVLDMYDVRKSKKNTSNAVRKQLQLNYCLGHNKSTMLLSPYGPGFSLVNHNQTLANVRLQWASPKRSNHHPEMLEKYVIHFASETSAKLAMELVALRDIQPDEEILLDYGDEWELAWQKHVRTWEPVEDAESYASAEQLNREEGRLKTEFEQMKYPNLSNVGLKFNMAFRKPAAWKSRLKLGGDLVSLKEDKGEGSADCEILRYKEVDGRIFYTAVITDEEDRNENTLVEEAPREAFHFVDRPYTSDMLLKNAFRHDIRIPDDMFPEAWKNIL